MARRPLGFSFRLRPQTGRDASSRAPCCPRRPRIRQPNNSTNPKQPNKRLNKRPNKQSTQTTQKTNSPWCGPCKLVAPLMSWAEKEYAGKLRVVKVEHDAAKELVERYGVYGLPAFLVVKEGAPVAGSSREGAMSKKALTAYLQEQLGLVATTAA